MAVEKASKLGSNSAWRNLPPGRVLTHLLLAIITIGACYLTALVAPDLSFDRVLLFGLGYTSMLLVGVSLLIGPLKLLKLRRNPLNIVMRRDIGIWAALTGGLHVLSLAVGKVSIGGQLLLQTSPLPYVNALGLHTPANVAGLLALLLLALLLMLSNNTSMRLLGGKRWKTLQRLNYLLFALALGHTLAYQLMGESGWGIVALVLGLTLLVLVAQSIGFMLYRARQRATQINQQQSLAG